NAEFVLVPRKRVEPQWIAKTIRHRCCKDQYSQSDDEPVMTSELLTLHLEQSHAEAQRREEGMFQARLIISLRLRVERSPRCRDKSVNRAQTASPARRRPYRSKPIHRARWAARRSLPPRMHHSTAAS